MRKRVLRFLFLTGLLISFLTTGSPLFAGNPQSCHADFSMTAFTTNPLEVHFTDKSTGTIYAWNWNFGDGGTSTWQNPVHIFPLAGIYTVCLTIQATDSSYCTDTHCDTLYAGPDTTTYLDLGGHLFAGLLPINNPQSTGDTGIACLYHVKNGIVSPADTVKFTYLGYYTFPHIAEGEYLVKAMLTTGSSHYSNYRPTYYPGAADISDAVVIKLSSDDYYADIHLVPGSYGVGDPGSLASRILAYPNPVENVLHLKIRDPGITLARIAVFDMQGRLILQEEKQNELSSDLDLSGLSKGVYFLKISFSQEDNPVRLKIIRE